MRVPGKGCWLHHPGFGREWGVLGLVMEVSTGGGWVPSDTDVLG